MKLTDTLLRGLKATGKVQKYSDGGGLYLHVSPTGGKLWRMDYRFEGKRKTLSMGAYPEVSLADARARRQAAKVQLAQGIDPSAHKQAAKAATRAESENTFEIVAREWFAKNKDSWVDTHAEKILRRLENYIFPIIGAKPVHQVTAPELLKALREVEAKGIPDVAHRALQNCSRIFRYAIATGRAERDTAADLRGALVPVQSENLASITEPKAIGALLRDIDAYTGNVIIRAALRMAPYVFVRPGELRRAEWAEFNLDGALWRIPAKRMKMRREHTVPLSRQVLFLLQELRMFSGAGRYLFPSARAKTDTISDAGPLAALRRMGYDSGDMCLHGFRAMASTRLNELGFRADVIEVQLAHKEPDAVRLAYNRAEYTEERRALMQSWADYLDSLREGKN